MTVRKVINLEEHDAIILHKKAFDGLNEEMDRLFGYPLYEQESDYEQVDLDPESDDPEDHSEEYIMNFISKWMDVENYSYEDLQRIFGVGDRQLRNKRRKYIEMGYDIPSRKEIQRKQSDQRKKEKQIYPGGGGRIPGRFRDAELFPGEFYRDMTRIPPRRWDKWYKIWKKKTPVRRNERRPLRDIRKPKIYFRKIFLFGYEFKDGSMYELWYNAHDGEYNIHDEFGNASPNSFRTMNDAIKAFIYYISTSEPEFKLDDLDTQDQQHMQQIAFGNRQAASRHFGTTVESFEKEYEEQLNEQKTFIEQTRMTRSMVTDLINNDLIESYVDESRITKYMAEVKFWQTFGKDQRVPPKYMTGGFKRALNVIRGFFGGDTITSKFMEGVALANKVEVEIWSINVERDSGRNFSYYAVFDLTSGQELGSGIPNRREAVKIAYRKVAAAAN